MANTRIPSYGNQPAVFNLQKKAIRILEVRAKQLLKLDDEKLPRRLKKAILTAERKEFVDRMLVWIMNDAILQEVNVAENVKAETLKVVMDILYRRHGRLEHSIEWWGRYLHKEAQR